MRCASVTFHLQQLRFLALRGTAVGANTCSAVRTMPLLTSLDLSQCVSYIIIIIISILIIIIIIITTILICRSSLLSDSNGLQQLSGEGGESRRDCGGCCQRLRELTLDGCIGVKAQGLCWLLQVSCARFARVCSSRAGGRRIQICCPFLSLAARSMRMPCKVRCCCHRHCAAWRAACLPPPPPLFFSFSFFFFFFFCFCFHCFSSGHVSIFCPKAELLI